jgi:hypothetical protein
MVVLRGRSARDAGLAVGPAIVIVLGPLTGRLPWASVLSKPDDE